MPTTRNRFARWSRRARVAAVCVTVAGCNAAASGEGVDAGTGNAAVGVVDASSDASARCEGPLDLAVVVIDQSGAAVGQANVTVSSDVTGADAIVRTDAFGVAAVEVPAPGRYQVLATKLVQLDPEIDYAFEDFLALANIDVRCGDESVEVQGQWACAGVALSGFELTVLDQTSGERICDAHVVDTSEEDRVLTSMDFGDGCVYSGSSLAGRHEVTIDAAGYAPQTVSIDVETIGIYCSYPVGGGITVVELTPQ